MRNNIIYNQKFKSYWPDTLAESNSEYLNSDNDEGRKITSRKIISLKVYQIRDKELVDGYLKKSQRFLNYSDSGNFSTKSSPKHLYSGSLLNASA